MLAWILKVLNPLEAIGRELRTAYALKLQAQNDHERIEAEKHIAKLEAQQSILIAEQGSWMTRWIRPALALPVVIFWAKLLVWDTVLQLGSTPDPGDHVMWYAMLIPSAYFLVRPFEKRR